MVLFYLVLDKSVSEMHVTLSSHLLPRESYLTDSQGVVQHRLGVGVVVAAWQLGVAEVGLQQQVGLGVGAVVGMWVDLQGELLSQLAVQLVLVVSDGQLRKLFCIL